MATQIWYEDDADLGVLAGQRVAVVGYGNQGRSWALNLRDSGLEAGCARAPTPLRAGPARRVRGRRVAAAATPTSMCVLVPDDVIPSLPLSPRPRAHRGRVAATRCAFDRFAPAGDIGMVAPRMLGPEVRRCYEEGVGFITAVGVHRDVTGTAQARTPGDRPRRSAVCARARSR